MTKSFATRVCGFTLVEILVVLAVIFTLAALIFPVFSSARRKGRDAACLNNLHQMGLATRLYADDYDGHYPYAIDPLTRDLRINILFSDEMIDTLPDYPSVLKNYTKDSTIFHCPSDVPGASQGKDASPLDGAFARLGTSYTYNEFLTFGYPWSSIQAADASKVQLYHDTGSWHGKTEASPPWDRFEQTVFLDLHVKRVNSGQARLEEGFEMQKQGAD